MIEDIKWDELVYYDPLSPTGIRWKIDRFSGEYYKRMVAKAGDTAGFLNHDGYYRIRAKGKTYAVSRVVWVLHHGAIDNSIHVDHIDGDRGNNNIENLRTVCRKINNQNRTMHKNNKTGVTGVEFCAGKEGHSAYFKATWYNVEGKQKTKCFSTNKFGHDNAFELACEYRKKIIEELNKLGENYSGRHGSA